MYLFLCMHDLQVRFLKVFYQDLKYTTSAHSVHLSTLIFTLLHAKPVVLLLLFISNQSVFVLLMLVFGLCKGFLVSTTADSFSVVYSCVKALH